MAVITVKKNQSFSDFSSGWKKLKIVSAEKGKYENGSETKYIDVRFEDYPDTLKLRVHEKFNKTTKEEFNLTRLFRYCNAGIKEVAESENDFRVEIDIEPKELIGSTIHAYFYKNKKGYTDISENVLPAEEFENKIEKWDAKKIEDSLPYIYKNQIKPYIPAEDEIDDSEWSSNDSSNDDDDKDPWD
jgi:hypothetical protein